MQSRRAFERCIHAAYDARTPHNYALHIVGNVAEGHRKTVVELPGEEVSRTVGIEKVRKRVPEILFVGCGGELCGNELRRKEWAFRHDALAKSKRPAEADLSLCLDVAERIGPVGIALPAIALSLLVVVAVCLIPERTRG